MKECSGKKFILNDELQPSELFDNSLVYEGESIYEVIRMIKGSPLFFIDHMERLEKSIKLQGKEPLSDAVHLRKAIISLVKSDKKKETNVKIVFNYNGSSSNYLVYFIDSLYPTIEQYRNGVKGVLFSAERKDPVSKVINHKLRTAIYNKLIAECGYEAILVNEENFITEGSRTNIFFIKGETLVTAPDNMVLNGITRKHILEICRDADIVVELVCVSKNDIADYDAVFMTGTSPMVLPFSSIGNIFFNARLPMMERLRGLYKEKAAESIRLFRSE